MLMTPGDIVMMLNEMGGLRVQATSPSLGAASVRIQGMRGRYTRFLADGLPLFGQQVGGLGLLQIPPMDLGQVEVIKGAASALYGAGAMGGVVNLISRRPAAEPVREFLLNRSTLGATDAVAFLSSQLGAPLERVAARRRALAGAQRSRRRRLGGPRGLRPRRGAAAVLLGRRRRPLGVLTGGVTYENREGGTMPGAALPATGEPYVGGARHAALRRRRQRADAGGGHVRRDRAGSGGVAAARPPFRRRARARPARHVFGEVALAARPGRTPGSPAPPRARRYRPRDVPRFAYTYDVPASSRRTTSTSRRGCRCRPARAWTSTTSTARSSARALAALFRARRLDQPRLGRPGLLRPDAADRGDRGRGPDAADVDRPARRRARADRVVRPHARARPDVVHGHGVRLARRRPGRPSSATTRTSCSTAAAARPIPAPSCWRRGARGRSRRPPATPTCGRARNDGAQDDAADAAAQRRPGRHVGGRGHRARRGRGLLHGPAAARGESVPRRVAPLRDLRLLAERRFGRVRLFLNAENLTDVAPDAVGPAAAAVAQADGRWTVDALGAARRPGDQRRACGSSFKA